MSFDEMREFTRRGAEHYGIDPSLAFAMFEQESQWDPKAVSPAGAIGVAQLMPETAKGLGVNPHDTWENIDGGLRYLKQQLDKYKDPSLALAAYNAGPGAVDRAKGIPQNAETPGHVQKVMSRYNDIRLQRFAAGKEAPGEEQKAFDATRPIDVLGSGDAFTALLSGAGQPAADFYKFLGGMEAKWQQTGETAQSAQQKIQDLALTEGGAGQLPLMPSGKPSSLVGAPLLATDLSRKPRPTVPAAYPAHELMAMDWPTGAKDTAPSVPLPPAEEQPFYKQGQKLQSMLDAMRMPGPVGDILHSVGTVGGIMVGTHALSSPAAVAAFATGTPGMEALYTIAPRAVETLFRYGPAATAGAIIGQPPGYEAAREAGKDPQESAEIAQWNMLVGTSMAAPVGQMLSKLDRFVGGGLRKTLWEMAKSGTSFASTMAFMNSMNNVVAKLNYDELRGVMDGVLENVPKDYIVGMLLFGIGAAAKRAVEGKAKAEGKPIPPEVYEFDERSQTWWEQVSPYRWIEAEAEPGLEIPGQAEVTSEVPKVSEAKKTTPVDLEKKLQKIEKRNYSANQVERTRKYYKDNYDIDLEIQDSEVKGKFRLVRKAPVEVAPTPVEPTELTLEQELQQNHEAAAEEIPPEVLTAPEEPMLTQEMRDALTAAREGKRATPEGLPLTDAERASLRHGLDLAAKWREEQAAKRAKESEDAATSVNRVDIGKEGLTEAEQTEIDDRVVDAYEKTKSYVQAAKEVGLSIAETKARHKYATGLTEKRPYDIVEEKAQPTERTLETPTEPYTDVRDALEKAGKVSGAGRVEAPPTFASQKEARAWLLENKKEGTIVPTGGKFKILDVKDASAYDLFSLSPNMSSDPVWYSKLQEAVVQDHANWPKRLNGADALKRIEKLVQGGKAKKEELDDMLRLTGLKARLEEMQGASRDDVLNEIMSNGIEVEERWIESPKYKNTSNYNLSGPREGYFELVLTSPQAGELPSDPAHFIEGKGKRQIGWVRGNWRTDAEGRRILFIEEVQSKRHQGEPDSTAPFQKSWLRLISRRLLRYAAENNADAVAWTTGEQQAERWSLRQVADELLYDGTQLRGWKDGEPTFNRDINEKDLLDYVGKDLAKQLIAGGDTARQFNSLTAKLAIADARLADANDQLNNASRVGGATSESQQLLLALRNAREKEADALRREIYFGPRETRVSVPEGYEFYSSKWPEKIYGFARGGYEKSLLATAMKEAMGQFKGKVGEVGSKRSAFDPALDQLYLDLMNTEDPAQRRILEQQIKDATKLPSTEMRLDEFSRQPSVTITPEAKAFWSKNPMALYSLSPNMINPFNVKGIKDFFDRRLEAIGAPDEIKRAYLADDMGWLESWAAQTQWLVDKNPRLYPIFETTHNMIGRAGVGVQEAIQSWAERWIALKPESKQRATDFEVDLDRKAEQLRKAEKSAYAERGITESRFVKTSAGNIRLNPKFHEQWYEKTRPLFKGTQEEFDLIFEHRKMYDKIAEVKWNMSRKYYKRGSNDLKRLREEVFLLQDYFPHQRDGEFALGGYVTDAEGNRSKVYDHAFDIPKALYAAQKMGNKFEVRKTGDKASYGTFKDKGAAESAAKKLGSEYYAADTGIRAIEGFVRNVIMPKIANDPILAQLQIPEGGWQIERRESPYIQSLANSPHTAMALQHITSRVSREIMKDKTKTPAEKAQLLGPYTKLWNEAIAETLRKGTLGGHWATRSGIHGYAVDDAGKVAHKYATQFYRTLAKMETATELTKLIKEVKGDRPNEAKWAARYMERVLDPDYDLTGIVGGLRSLSYFSMINPIRFFGVNLTNGVVSGAQQIVADTGNVAWKYIPKAIWDATRWYMKKTKLPAEEERMLKELHDNGVLRPQFLDAISRRLEADPEAKSLLWWKFKNVITTPARSSEIISRLYTALAAFRAANDGLVSSERAKERFGSAITERVKGPMTDEQYQRNTRYAAKIVDDSHMIWGELNRPEIVTRGAVGKALGSALIFRHYSQGLFHMWKSLYGEGGNRGYGRMAMAESLAAQMLLGGTIAGGILNGFYQAIFGTNMWDDARKNIGSTATDLLEYGAPSLVGLSMHSSFDLEPPEAWDELFGVPASIVKNWSKAWKAASVKDYQKAFEYTVPLKIARDLSVAVRLGTEGLTTAGGSPVSAPGSSEPYKISLPEAVGQAAGFSPMSTTHLWEAQEATMSMEQRRQKAQDAWVTRYTNALRRGDQKEMTAVIDEAVAWNDKWISKGVPQLAVDIGPAIKQRVKPVQPSRKMRGLAREMQERALRMQQD